MFNMKNAIKPIEVNVDTKNFDVQFVRDKKKGKTYIEIDTDSVDIVYQKNGDVKIFKLDTESDILDIEIRTDKDGTKVLIGINQDGEHTIEYGNAIDNQWHYGDAIVVKSGDDVRVFDDSDNLLR